MKAWIITTIAALVLTSLGGFLINRYGQARYDAGYASAKNDVAEATSEFLKHDANGTERIEHETHIMSDDDVDNSLRQLGIMRAQADR